MLMKQNVLDWFLKNITVRCFQQSQFYVHFIHSCNFIQLSCAFIGALSQRSASPTNYSVVNCPSKQKQSFYLKFTWTKTVENKKYDNVCSILCQGQLPKSGFNLCTQFKYNQLQNRSVGKTYTFLDLSNILFGDCTTR